VTPTSVAEHFSVEFDQILGSEDPLGFAQCLASSLSVSAFS
jgi:hypothetical protein